MISLYCRFADLLQNGTVKIICFIQKIHPLLSFGTTQKGTKNHTNMIFDAIVCFIQSLLNQSLLPENTGTKALYHGYPMQNTYT